MSDLILPQLWPGLETCGHTQLPFLPISQIRSDPWLWVIISCSIPDPAGDGWKYSLGKRQFGFEPLWWASHVRHYASPGHYGWPQPIDSGHQDVIHALRNHYVDCYEESNFIPNQIIYWDPIHNNLDEDKFAADTQSLFHFNGGIPQEIAFLNNLTKISRNIPVFVWLFGQMDVIMKHLGFVPPFSIVALGNTARTQHTSASS